jgi:hypothetical protein
MSAETKPRIEQQKSTPFTAVQNLDLSFRLDTQGNSSFSPIGSGHAKPCFYELSVMPWDIERGGLENAQRESAWWRIGWSEKSLSREYSWLRDLRKGNHGYGEGDDLRQDKPQRVES